MQRRDRLARLVILASRKISKLTSAIDSSIWQIHLDAAKTVLYSRKGALSTQDATAEFLERELFIANAFASTTNFNTMLSPKMVPSDGFSSALIESTGIFVEFMKLIEMITRLERDAKGNPVLLLNSGISSRGLQKLFEDARSRTLEISNTMHISSEHDYISQGRTVNCFYHAGLLYSHRALLKPAFAASDTEVNDQVAIFKAELFYFLDFPTPSNTSLQYLVWPLFIAGTEATQTFERELVVGKLKGAMAGTGFTNCQHALEFLDALWALRDLRSECEETHDWIEFAREWTKQGRTFFVY